MAKCILDAHELLSHKILAFFEAYVLSVYLLDQSQMVRLCKPLFQNVDVTNNVGFGLGHCLASLSIL